MLIRQLSSLVKCWLNVNCAVPAVFAILPLWGTLYTIHFYPPILCNGRTYGRRRSFKMYFTLRRSPPRFCALPRPENFMVCLLNWGDTFYTAHGFSHTFELFFTAKYDLYHSLSLSYESRRQMPQPWPVNFVSLETHFSFTKTVYGFNTHPRMFRVQVTGTRGTENGHSASTARYQIVQISIRYAYLLWDTSIGLDSKRDSTHVVQFMNCRALIKIKRSDWGQEAPSARLPTKNMFM